MHIEWDLFTIIIQFEQGFFGVGFFPQLLHLEVIEAFLVGHNHLFVDHRMRLLVILDDLFYIFCRLRIVWERRDVNSCIFDLEEAQKYEHEAGLRLSVIDVDF